MSTPPKPVAASVNGWSPDYLLAQFERYQADPNSVSEETRAFFRGYELAEAGELRVHGVEPKQGKPSPAAGPARSVAASFAPADDGPVRITPAMGQPAGRATRFQAVVDDLISAYRDQGHLAAKLDPFGDERPRPADLSAEFHGLSEADLGRTVSGEGLGLSGGVPLRDVVDRLEQIYCGRVGVEFMHIADSDRRRWLFERFEKAGGRLDLDRGSRAHVLETLIKAEMFERFLGKRYPGEKRFSLEGSETLIPLLDRMLESSSELGVESVVLGMAHRGRLTVLNTILGKTYRQIFTEFEETWLESYEDGGGDVKYHRGYSGTKRFRNGRMLHLAMASNPSHLEAVNPVVLGRARAKQRLRNDVNRDRVVPVLIHGDAAVVGQGVVAECLNLSKLEGYTTGGTVHVVVNNQIGFTTLPEDGRSSRYCTDIAKSIDAPVFHVNGEDPEAVVAVAQFAMEYRQAFRGDVFIDLQCYRRYGHNEQDEMSFTQPQLAAKIKKQPHVLDSYTKTLLADGVINDADISAIRFRLDEALEEAQKQAKSAPHDPTIDPGSARWEVANKTFSFDRVDTGVPMETLTEVCDALGTVPEGFNVNRKLRNLLKGRSELPATKELSYADAESLAFGTLLVEGVGIRVSGQDARRGTFSHRHAVLRDSESAEPYVPLNNIREMGEVGTNAEPGTPGADGRPRQGRLCVYDSPLSEYAVLGYDYGYALADPKFLVCWEAQFGDFVNGAQIMIDQFITSAEQKWERWNGLVMLLPHGYEGQGPEHSSARLERFLEACAGKNIQVAYPTTAAQIFHLLRRQIARPFRKPLVVMTPKSLLRKTTSTIEELTTGSFQEFLDDPAFASGGLDRGGVERVVLCSGKLYWELDERRRARLDAGESDAAKTAIIRVEQFYPFHADLFKELLARYPAAAERLVYAQEEPRNMAGYRFMNETIMSVLGLPPMQYVGRAAAASPAVGSKKIHKIEQEAIITEAIGSKPAEKADAAGSNGAASSNGHAPAASAKKSDAAKLVS